MPTPLGPFTDLVKLSLTCIVALVEEQSANHSEEKNFAIGAPAFFALPL